MRLGGPPAHPLARGQQLTPGTLRERLHTNRSEQFACRSQLGARIDAAILAAQPLPVQQLAAGKLWAEARAPQALDRFAVRALGGLAPGEQRARSGVDAERPVGVAFSRRPVQSSESSLCEPGVLGPGRSLDQLAQRPRLDEQLRCVLARLDGRRERLLITPEAVHQYGVGPTCVLESESLTDGGCFREDALDQLRGLGLVPAHSRER